MIYVLISFALWLYLVVAQYYDTDVNKAYVIRGNAAVLKCEIPSFVADFVSVVSWHTDHNEDFLPGTEYGLLSNKFSTSGYCISRAICTVV